MTAKELYDKMILGEVKPEIALEFFKNTGREYLAKMFISMQEAVRPLTTDEQWQNMINPGSVGRRMVYEAEQKVNQSKADSFLLSGYIKAAEAMIEKQKKVTQPEDTQANEQLSQVENNFEQTLFGLFPVFKIHSEFLKKKGYYEISESNLRWVHGGNTLLAGYFGMIQDIPGTSRFMWSEIESAFNTKHLAQHWSDYETMRKAKTAKHEKYDKELRDLISGKTRL